MPGTGKNIVNQNSTMALQHSLESRQDDKASIASKSWSTNFTKALFAAFPREIRDLIYHHLCGDPTETVIIESDWLEIGAFKLPHYMNPDIMPPQFIQEMVEYWHMYTSLAIYDPLHLDEFVDDRVANKPARPAKVFGLVGLLSCQPTAWYGQPE